MHFGEKYLTILVDCKLLLGSIWLIRQLTLYPVNYLEHCSLIYNYNFNEELVFTKAHTKRV